MKINKAKVITEESVEENVAKIDSENCACQEGGEVAVNSNDCACALA